MNNETTTNEAETEETEEQRQRRIEIIGGWQKKCREFERQRRGQEKQQQPHEGERRRSW